MKTVLFGDISLILFPAYNAFLNKMQTVPVVYVPTLGAPQPGKESPSLLLKSSGITLIHFYSPFIYFPSSFTSRFLHIHTFSSSLHKSTTPTSAASATTLALEYKALTSAWTSPLNCRGLEISSPRPGA